MTKRGTNKDISRGTISLESLRIESAFMRPGYVEAVLKEAQWVEDGRVKIHAAAWARVRGEYNPVTQKRKGFPLLGDMVEELLRKLGVKKKPVAGAGNGRGG